MRFDPGVADWTSERGMVPVISVGVAIRGARCPPRSFRAVSCVLGAGS